MRFVSYYCCCSAKHHEGIFVFLENVESIQVRCSELTFTSFKSSSRNLRPPTSSVSHFQLVWLVSFFVTVLVDIEFGLMSSILFSLILIILKSQWWVALIRLVPQPGEEHGQGDYVYGALLWSEVIMRFRRMNNRSITEYNAKFRVCGIHGGPRILKLVFRDWISWGGEQTLFSVISGSPGIIVILLFKYSHF